MNDFTFSSIQELKEYLRKKEISVEQLLDFFIKRFTEHDKTLETALEIFEKHSIMQQAAKEGLLSGIPGLLKDNICQQGRIASCASKMLQHYRAPYNATVTKRLNAAGALCIGRANMDEFAMGSSTETSAFAKTKNPWHLGCVPGGSSGGSAAAVAAGLVPWALGSETGGSVRQPASLCGVVGLKPTYGLVSRNGLIAYASSLDQIGPITRTVYDNALVFSVLAGHDSNDSTSLPVKPQDYTQYLNGKLPEGFTLGVIDNAMQADGIDPEVISALEQAIKTFEKLGARIKRVNLPLMNSGAAVYFMISRAEAASNLARFDGVRYGYRSAQQDTLSDMYAHTRSEGFGWEVKRRILLGNYVLSAGHADAYYNSAKKVQGLMRNEFIQAFKEVNLLFAPVSPAPAFAFGAFADNKLAMDLQDYFTAPANLAGVPALAVPCGFTKSKMPIGFQLIGPDLSEDQLFQAGHAYEQSTLWHTMHPTL